MKKLRSIVGYFEKSTQATSKLLNFQSKSDVKEYKEQPRPKKLLQDVVTRWWSTYRMLRRARFLKKAIMGLLAAEEVSCDTMSASEWAILHQIEITLETMAHFQRVLEGEYYVTASLVPIAVYQIRKKYQEVINSAHSLEEVKNLVKILLADFDECYHPADGNGKLQYSSVASVGFRNRYVTVHHSFFFAAYLDPRTKPLLKDMMTTVDFGKLKSDIIDHMVTEGLLANQSDKMTTSNVNTCSSMNALSAEDANNDQTGVARRMALMFHGLNTTSTYDDEGEMDEEGKDTNSAMIRNECMAEFNRFKQNSVSIPLYTTDGSLGDPLEWWKKNQLKYPYLARLASLYLAVPATSAPSERIWSRASRILTLKRANLKEKVAQRMMFIKENLSVLHKYYGSLAERDRTEDKYYLIDMEKTYLPPLQEYDANGDDLVDVGQNDD